MQWTPAGVGLDEWLRDLVLSPALINRLLYGLSCETRGRPLVCALTVSCPDVGLLQAVAALVCPPGG